MKEAGLVKSTRGSKGGHQLDQPPEKISVGQIVRLFEGQSDLVECVGVPEKCDRADECTVRSVWLNATNAMHEKLDEVTIADLLKPKARVCRPT